MPSQIPSRFLRFLDALQGVLVLLALFLTPLIHTSQGYEQFLIPKMAWVSVLAGLLVLIQLGRALRGGEARVALHGVNGWLGLFFLWNLLMWPLANSPSLAGERVVWLAAVFAVCWCWQEWAAQRRRRILTAAWCLACVAGITAGWGLFQDLRMKWPGLFPNWLQPSGQVVNRLGDWRGLIWAGFGNTDFIAMFLGAAYLPTLLLALQARRLWRAGVLLGVLWLCAAALIVCWSVGNNAALILGFVIVATGIGRKRRGEILRRRKKRLGVWLAGCACVVLWLVTNTPLNPHRPTDAQRAHTRLPGIFAEAFSSERWIAGGPTRGVIWLNTLEMIRRNQLKGVGPGCFVYVFPGTRSSFVPDDPAWLQYQGIYTNAAHNTLLQTWAELGPVGAFLLLAAVIAAFRAMARRARESQRDAASDHPARKPLDGWIAWGGIGALSVLCAASLMSFPLQLPSITVLFFALLPLGEMLGDPSRGERGFRMPTISFEGRWTRIVLYPRDMNRLVAAGASFLLPGRIALAVFLGGAVLCGAWSVHTLRPLVSDVLYNRGRMAEQAGAFERAEAFYLRALAVHPNHHDCRSRYSDFLLRRARYQECVAQMDILFRRLDASELYLRRAEAFEKLGRRDDAVRDLTVYYQRVPMAARFAAPRQP